MTQKTPLKFRMTGWTAMLAITSLLFVASLLLPKALEALPDKFWETACDTMGIYDQGYSVLFGDSLMAQLGMAARFGWNPYKNRSKEGRLATRSIEPFSQALKNGTRLVVILLGTNDLGLGKPVQDIAAALETMGQKAGARGIEVVLCSVIPDRHGDKGKRSPEILGILNNRIKEICRARNFHVLDLYPLFADTEGVLEKNYTSDGLHLNATGKDKLAQSIINTVKKLTRPAQAEPAGGH